MVLGGGLGAVKDINSVYACKVYLEDDRDYSGEVGADSQRSHAVGSREGDGTNEQSSHSGPGHFDNEL